MVLNNSNTEDSRPMRKKISASLLTFLLLLSGTASLQYAAFEVSATGNDQDSDGLPYGIEFLINTQPQDWDSDNDGLTNVEEKKIGTDPFDSDTDNDGLEDGEEVILGIDKLGEQKHSVVAYKE